MKIETLGKKYEETSNPPFGKLPTENDVSEKAPKTGVSTYVNPNRTLIDLTAKGYM